MFEHLSTGKQKLTILSNMESLSWGVFWIVGHQITLSIYHLSVYSTCSYRSLLPMYLWIMYELSANSYHVVVFEFSEAWISQQWFKHSSNTATISGSKMVQESPWDSLPAMHGENGFLVVITVKWKYWELGFWRFYSERLCKQEVAADVCAWFLQTKWLILML